jgi:hypothetical protein
MSYRVEYNGRDVEATTLDAAIEDAKDAIAADVGPVSGWTVEHDETINDWFVQGVVNGEPVGSTAVVSGPEPTMVAETGPSAQYGPPAQHGPPPQHRAGVYGSPVGEHEEWLRAITFTGVTPAEAFGRATTWLAARPDAVDVGDVGWRAPSAGEAFELQIHYRDGTQNR